MHDGCRGSQITITHPSKLKRAQNILAVQKSCNVYIKKSTYLNITFTFTLCKYTMNQMIITMILDHSVQEKSIFSFDNNED